MKKLVCPLCKREVPALLYEMHVAMDQLAILRMKKDFPNWKENQGVCEPCLQRYKDVAK